jgi:hypothetical protein
VILKSYFDGGNEADSPEFSHACLSVVSGSAKQWKRFESAWNKVLHKHEAGFLHVTDAIALQNDFSPESGWSNSLVDDFIGDCVRVIARQIEIPEGSETPYRPGLCPTTLLIPLADWLKARENLPALPNTVAELCATESLGYCLKQGKKVGARYFELYFDQGEPFYGHVSDRLRSSKARKLMPLLDSIIHLGESNMRLVPGLQVADLFAWCVNHNHRVIRDWHGWVHGLPWRSLHLDYELLMKPHPRALEMTRELNLPKRVKTEVRIARMGREGQIPEVPHNLLPKRKES